MAKVTSKGPIRYSNNFPKKDMPNPRLIEAKQQGVSSKNTTDMVIGGNPFVVIFAYGNKAYRAMSTALGDLNKTVNIDAFS